MAESRVTKLAAEVLHSGPASTNARVTGLRAEVLHSGAPSARVSMLALEVLRSVAVGVDPTSDTTPIICVIT